MDGGGARCGMDPETPNLSLAKILPTLISSTGGTELLRSRRVTVQREVASCTSFPQ